MRFTSSELVRFLHMHLHRSAFASSDASARPAPLPCALRQRLNVSSWSLFKKARDVPEEFLASTERALKKDTSTKNGEVDCIKHTKPTWCCLRVQSGWMALH